MPELPLEIWKDRIENELESLERLNVLEKNSIIYKENSVEFIVNIISLGFILKEGSESLDLIPRKNHKIMLKLNRNFPYPGGIDFAWYTPIFHPNIHPVELGSGETGTGYICLNVLKKWSLLSDMDTTIKALKLLVEHPNPDDPLNYPICLEATEFFKQNKMADLKEKYDFEKAEVEEAEEDIVIIDD